ncbi:MAG: hypothetical protein H0W50_06650 [Parachlamydiaceae bacterium]|nr:hypothetical protein [Parachlamydiaceae bacterium]
MAIDSFSILPKKLANNIISYLDFKSVLNLEIVSKIFSSRHCKSRVTNQTWRELKLRDGLNYDWKMCKIEINPPKWEYRLSRALQQYLLVHKYHNTSNGNLARIIRFKYLDLMLKFPILKAYIGVDLFRLYNSTNYYLFYVRKNERRKFLKMCLAGASGEKLFQGLLLTRARNFPNSELIVRLENIFYNTMNVSATLASLFALELSLPRNKIEQMVVRLAVKAETYNDFRALYKLMST